MKELLLLILSAFIYNLNAQNLIQNGDFELCNGDPSCPSLPNAQSQCGYLLNWDATHMNSPDWYNNSPYNNQLVGLNPPLLGPSPPLVTAQSGTHYIGMYDNEGIEYDLGSTIPDGPYVITLWVQGSPPLDAGNTWGVVVYGSDHSLVKLLLQKVEELTLYTINLEKRLSFLEIK